MSISKEDYLKVIYQLGGREKQVNNKDIANHLNISAPSVSEMIKKLLDDGYIEYSLYRGVKLTQYGLEEAVKIRRRHLIWEVFLVEKLGYSWDEVDEEAEKLEHITSPQLEERLYKYLNCPKTCPHGTLIVNDKEEDITYRTLDMLKVGEETVIHRIKDSKEVLKNVNEKNLSIGTKVCILGIDQSLRQILLKINDKEKTIDLQLAKNIYVD